MYYSLHKKNILQNVNKKNKKQKTESNNKKLISILQ